MLNKTFLAGAMLAALGLAGCGDNPESAVPVADPLSTVPDSAQADAAGLVTYLEVLADNTTETREPAELEAVMLTLREDTEPIALK